MEARDDPMQEKDVLITGLALFAIPQRDASFHDCAFGRIRTPDLLHQLPDCRRGTRHSRLA